MTSTNPIRLSLALVAWVLLASCSPSGKNASPLPSRGVAFVGPATLKLRKDIPLGSETVVTVKHGDRLDLLQARRRFYLVRTSAGAEGWTDERQLLSSSEMDGLRELSERTAGMPLQGQATTFAELNLHTQPSRTSPSFYIIKENEQVGVVMHVAATRVDLVREPLLPPLPKKTKAAAAKKSREKDKQTVPQPPMPAPPKPPANWLDLSKTDFGKGDDQGAEPPQKGDDLPQAPVTQADYWTVVRTASGEAGWVLTRRLFMAVPDEVAQYAEGHRIVSYFSLGSVDDGGVTKPTWLWTTMATGLQPFDFDSIRVFSWSLRRHRYETSYVERDMHGYSPVLVSHPADGGRSAPAASFSLCLDKQTGQRVRREYSLQGATVRRGAERPCEAPGPPLVQPSQRPASLLPLDAAAAPVAKESITVRLRKQWDAFKRRWLGR